MKLENKDFVWVYNGSEKSIEWGVVVNNTIIKQDGGFYDLNDFDNCLARPIKNETDICYIGGIVRYANSFNSAKINYYNWLTTNYEYNDDICVIPNGDTFIRDRDKELYLNFVNSPLHISVGELEALFDREVYIIA